MNGADCGAPGCPALWQPPGKGYLLTAPSDSFISVGFGSVTEDEMRSRWLGPITAAWPGSAPSPSVLSPQALSMKMELATQSGEGEWLAPLLLVADDIANDGVSRMIDSLQMHFAPALILAPCPQVSMRKLESEGVVVAPWDTPAPVLAAMLYALARRQRTVERIAVDLRVSRRAQRGVSCEMQQLQDELASAADVQREFLPQSLPEMPELEFGVVFRPVGYVSGDMYDLFRLDDRTVGFFIADVVGHGVPAALLTVALCRGLQTMDRSGDGWKPRRPCQVLAKLNDDLVARQLSGQRFATGIYGIIDRITGQVTVSCAGHPPPLVVSREGSREMDASGPLLGVFADAEFDEATCVLAPGESLVLYTDGVETAFPSSAGFRRPSQTYREIFSRIGVDASQRGLTVAATMTELAGEFDRQAGSLHGVDDITVVAISRPESAAARRAA